MRFLLVGPSGLEPPTSCLSGTRSNLLSYEPMWLVSDFRHLNLFAPLFRKASLLTFLLEESKWWRWRDSNPWPPACRAGALPAELHPHGLDLLSFRFSEEGIILPRCQHWAIFPCGRPQSIFTTAELNFRVRNGNGWTLCVCNTDYFNLSQRTFFLVLWKLNNKFRFLFISSIVYVTSRLTYNTFSIERRWSSRTFRYGYLVTT